MQAASDDISGGGSGRSLPKPLLFSAAAAAIFSAAFSFYSINQQLRAYRKPILQRYVVRLLMMVPIYSLSSMSSLFSLQAAFVIDVIRDVYEGFVIWSFFSLLVEYLGGERSLLILVHGRKPITHPFPFNYFLKPLDISDPYTFLGLKRGILQYVQLKPILAGATLILKSFGKYDDGKLAVDNGYTWVSVTYNFSVFLSLYCLGMFWSGLSEDLAPFRVTSKFLCIKGIIFFSFWQGFGVSILVAAGIIKQIGPVRDEEYIGLAVQDMLICLEMPLFALGHAYAFSPKDYIDPFSRYQSRLPAIYALRDAIGMYDVISDSLMTIRGTGYGYQTFEPSEGVMHQGLGRERRVRAGLRYTQGGKAKYWLPLRGAPEDGLDGMWARHQGPGRAFRRWLDRKRMEREGYAPLLHEQIEETVHIDPDLEAGSQVSHDEDPLGVYQKDAGQKKDRRRQQREEEAQEDEQPHTLLGRARRWARDHAQASLDYIDQAGDAHDEGEEAAELQFSDVDPDGEDERLYNKSRALKHGDYRFPAVDVQEEEARQQRYDDDEAMLSRYRARKRQRAFVGRILGQKPEEDGRKDGADDDQGPSTEIRERSDAGQKSPARPPGVVDLLVEDSQAEERERLRERRRGDPALRSGGKTRVFRRKWQGPQQASGSSLLQHGDDDQSHDVERVTPRERPQLEPEEMPPPSKSHKAARLVEDAERMHHPNAYDVEDYRKNGMPTVMQRNIVEEQEDEQQDLRTQPPKITSDDAVEINVSNETALVAETVDVPETSSPKGAQSPPPRN